MRIVVWNINGLRTLKGYQPWYKLPDWEACLEHLNADIACFQETKMTRKQLTESMCILPSYNTFFNFHPTKGYSGTVTYVRKAVSIPLKAEQGITGRLPATNVSSNPSIHNEPIGCVPADTRDDVEPKIWDALDQEGRCVVLDLGLFVLFNVYCPNETGPERLEYKMTYYQCLAERAYRLIAAGREVMIVGDMNIIRDPIDHCDPEQSMKEHGWDHFHQHPARSWFKSFLKPQGKFHDVGREFHPDRNRMYTCWNTLIDARPANYGVRLDYTLVTEGLLPWIKGADIQADVYGSDHCPIYVDLHDEREVEGKVVKLRDIMQGGVDRLPPALAAVHYDEFSGKQRKLASFFGGAGKKVAPAKGSSPPAVVATASPVAQKAQSDTGGSNIADSAEKKAEATPSLPLEADTTCDRDEEGGSLADTLFALHTQQEGLDIEIAPQWPDASSSLYSNTTKLHSASKGVDSASASAPIPPSGKIVPWSTKAAASQPFPKAKPIGASPKRTPSAQKGKETSKAKNAANLKGQASLKSFFAKPSSSCSTSLDAQAQPDDVSKDEIESTAPHTNGSQSSSLAENCVTVTNGGKAGSVEISDQDEEIYEFQEGSCQPHTSTCTCDIASRPNDSMSMELSAAERVKASQTWGAIFSPLPAPLCRNHSEACRAWTVNKPGPNHGRKFWLCNRPVGPGYEKGGRAKADVNPEFRCNFFLWDSDLRSKKKGNTSTNDEMRLNATGEAKFFSEVGRDRFRKKSNSGIGGVQQQDAQELGGPWGPHKRVKTADS